ncbi:MAG: carbohydrate binding family 9 domain-containing protein [Pseudohongiella sp.]|nr:carbohydrate binding family 9 domain-containing protein [Pseudohongiella sp.]
MVAAGRCALWLAVVTALYTTHSLAQETAPASVNTQKQFRAIRVDVPPVIDGVLDDAVWAQAEVITDFHQTRPGNGTPTSERTEVYVVYTDDALYIGARMFDSEPELIAAPVIRHGLGMPSDDRLVVILDPFNSRRAGYRFETNLNAARHDALYTSVSSFSLDWNTIWDVAANVDGKSWVAEIEIPFKSIPFDPAIETWGFNFGRAIRRRGEEMAWVSQNRTYNPSISGQMTGMTGLSKGVGLDLVPSMAVNRQRRYDPVSKKTDYVPSLDAFYRITPSLNAALTINTDFSATEVDSRQVNLTRFNLFFPEKRDFFLNDSDLFQFGNIGGMAGGNNATSQGARENARPFFSRKLGLSQTGAPVDINYGGRISGRVGRWNIGTLAIRQDEFGPVDSSDLFITRVSANVLNDSSLGFIYTNGDPGSNRDNSVAGVDFKYLNNQLSNGRQFEADAWYQVSDTPGMSGDDASYGFGLRLPNNTGWRSRMAYKEVQRNFNPAMGYVNRSNVRDLTGDLGYTHFFGGDVLQSIFSGVDAQRIEVIDGGLQSEVFVYRLAELQTNTRDSVSASYTTNREVVLQPFTLYSSPARQVSILPGDYQFNEYQFSVGTGGQREFSGSFSYQGGDFYNGTRTNLNGSVSWNQSRYFVASINYDWNDISLPQGDFITRLTSVSTQVAFSSTLYWINLVQYDNLSEEVGINTRLQWIPKAGQEGFVVLNYNMQDKDKNNRFESAFSDLSVKFKYTFRF